MPHPLGPALDVLAKAGAPKPRIALILGSGLGALAETIPNPLVVPTTELPGYPQSTVQGHAGRLVFGTLAGQSVLFIQGRAHAYEGHEARTLGFPVRLAHALGAERLLVTNAAGSLRPDWKPGTVMLIEDHINMAFRSVLAGTPAENEERFTDLSRPYDRAWSSQVLALARNIGLTLRRGTYLWTLGPNYETPAEIQFYKGIGADAVGMSTVPEVIQARALGMKVVGLSTLTNLAAGLSPTALNHDEVLAVGATLRDTLSTLITRIVGAL